MRCGDTGHRFLVLLPGIVLPDRLSNPRPMLRENRPQEERTPHTGGGGGQVTNLPEKADVYVSLYGLLNLGFFFSFDLF